MRKQQFILVVIACIFTGQLFAQKGWGNFRDFDRQKFHFGCSMGGNSSGYNFGFVPGTYNGYAIANASIKNTIGASFAIIGSWNINEFIHIRTNFSGFSFQERVFNYTYLKGESWANNEFRLESTFLNFPLMLKLRTRRIGNFAALH